MSAGRYILTGPAHVYIAHFTVVIEDKKTTSNQTYLKCFNTFGEADNFSLIKVNCTHVIKEIETIEPAPVEYFHRFKDVFELSKYWQYMPRSVKDHFANSNAPTAHITTITDTLYGDVTRVIARKTTTNDPVEIFLQFYRTLK